MVGLISHNPKPVARNFYENSFKQLSDIQQKQVGLLVGVSVADAAARALEGFSADEISALQSSRDGDITSHGRGRKAVEESPVVFANVNESDLRGHTALSDEGWRELRQQRGRSPLVDHSFSYMLYFGLLRTMSATRGEFPVSFVEPLWVEASHRVHPGLVFAQQHGSLLHTLCTLLPVPTIYPYASDETLRAYVDPFIDSLTTPPPSTSSLQAGDAAELAKAGRGAVRDFTKSALSVVLRYLQSNPDPERNAAFMAIPGTAAIFNEARAAFCPPLVRRAIGGGDGVIGNPNPASSDPPPPADPFHVKKALPIDQKASAGINFLPIRSPLQDAVVVREAFAISRTSRSFAEGVVQAVRAGGSVCQRAMLVGALLGARFGARQIPIPWISATVDHKPLVTMAIEVAQWAWNPPHR
ncbi:unnamed protein product [Phytomonas sp. EM1]|nr:unnamed protein product [Phytomonas sp. EM1]|eukprot:CCW62241.1 unnamed protein product [Phytomonas sp. isolate EM1]